MRLQNNWDWKGNEEQVGDDVAGAHSNELRIALTTLGPRVWHDLPVVGEGLAFCQGSDYDGSESDGEEPPNKVEAQFVLPSPDSAS